MDRPLRKDRLQMTLAAHAQQEDHAIDRLARGRDHGDQVGLEDLCADLVGGGVSPGPHGQGILG